MHPRIVQVKPLSSSTSLFPVNLTWISLGKHGWDPSPFGSGPPFPTPLVPNLESIRLPYILGSSVDATTANGFVRCNHILLFTLILFSQSVAEINVLSVSRPGVAFDSISLTHVRTTKQLARVHALKESWRCQEAPSAAAI